LIYYNFETKKEHFVNVKFYFRSRYVETLNNKCIRHKAIVLYVSHLTAYWETNTAVLTEQMMQNFFMLNVAREVLHIYIYRVIHDFGT